MKLIFIILLILSSNCFGQKDIIHTRYLSEVKDGTFLGTHYTTDTIHLPKVHSVNDTIPDTLIGGDVGKGYYPTIQIGGNLFGGELIHVDSANVVSWANDYNDTLHFDTVKVMMVYADTTRSITGASLDKNGIIEYWNYYFIHKDLQWQYGYRVQKLHNGWPETYFPYKEAIGYLDTDKHPLPKSIVVWKTIEIK